VTAVLAPELLLDGRALGFEPALDLALPVLQLNQFLAQRGNLIVHFLVAGLIGQEEPLALGEGFGFIGGGRDALLEREALELEQLVHRLLRVARAVAQHRLPLLPRLDRAIGRLDLAAQRLRFPHPLLIAEPVLNLLEDRSRPGADIAHREAEQPVNHEAEETGEGENQDALGPGSFGRANGLHPASVAAGPWQRGIEKIPATPAQPEQLSRTTQHANGTPKHAGPTQRRTAACCWIK
jgi:hypothetical protein